MVEVALGNLRRQVDNYRAEPFLLGVRKGRHDPPDPRQKTVGELRVSVRTGQDLGLLL